jgi:hypothetical protein
MNRVNVTSGKYRSFKNIVVLWILTLDSISEEELPP